MDDLISRQEALNIRFSDAINEDGVLYVPFRDFSKGLKALPSAQPELIEKTAYIRGFEQGRTQGMIDAQEGKEMNKQRKIFITITYNELGIIVDTKAEEIDLSAQPDIIRCKDCKHFEYDHPYIIQGVPVLGHEVCNAWGDGCKTDENGYCFMAERRTDEA